MTLDSKILIVGGHGLGDCLLAFQCLHYLRVTGYKNTRIAISSRKEIQESLQFLFWKEEILMLDENISSNHQIEKGEYSEDVKLLLSQYDKVYYVIPDLMFNNKMAFNFNDFRVTPSPQIIKSLRTLLDRKQRTDNLIYCGLQSVTPGYLYQEIPKLLVSLANALPSYEIYFPNISKWSGKDTFHIKDKTEYPSNVLIDDNPNFLDSLAILTYSKYFIGTDNGPSHVAYHLGIPRTILDPQFNNLPWVARWKEDVSDSIPINMFPDTVANIVKKNIEMPQTLMIPRICMAMSQNADWKQKLFIKDPQ